jgi:hypothetical protein
MEPIHAGSVAAATFQPLSVTGLVSPAGRFVSADIRDRLRLGMVALANQRASVLLSAEEILRSADQNSGYWAGVITPFAEFLGYTKRECHEACKLELLGLEPPDGDRPPRVRSTTKLTDREFAHYVQDILVLAAKQGCVINVEGPWR